MARPGIKCTDDLRGKRVGVRVVGAGIWISTILALEQLGLSPDRDSITAVPTGSPAEIVRALEAGHIDAALVTVAQSRALQARGYVALLADYAAGISTYGLCLAATADYMTTHPDVVGNTIVALIDALAFALAEKSRDSVMRAFESWLNITDAETASGSLSELNPRPYPSLAALAKMQSIMAMHNPRLMQVRLETLVDDRIVRNLDESGTIARLYDTYRSITRG